MAPSVDVLDALRMGVSQPLQTWRARAWVCVPDPPTMLLTQPAWHWADVGDPTPHHSAGQQTPRVLTRAFSPLLTDVFCSAVFAFPS